MIKYDKLIRDNIPKIIENSGKKCTVEVMDDDMYLEYLDRKLNEELAEYQADKSIEELADLLEVVYAVSEARGCSVDELERLRTEKDVERLILLMPFKRFEGMGYMRHSKYLGIIQIDKSIMKTLDDDDISTILSCCTDALERYWGSEKI